MGLCRINTMISRYQRDIIPQHRYGYYADDIYIIYLHRNHLRQQVFFKKTI